MRARVVSVFHGATAGKIGMMDADDVGKRMKGKKRQIIRFCSSGHDGTETMTSDSDLLLLATPSRGVAS